jgi:hypothetical protein
VLLGAGFGVAGVQAVFGDPIAGNEDLPPDPSDVD